MNKSFKVLWNRFRNSYVVASEATASQGKAGKAAKTMLTAAVVGAMALGGVAAAKTIDNGSFGTGDGQYDSTKFISGNGESLVIKTDGDVTKLISAIKNYEDTGISGILEALGTPDGTVTLVGVSGGQNFTDSGTQATFSDGLIKTVLDAAGGQVGVTGLGQKLEKTIGKFADPSEGGVLSGDTNIRIGSDPVNEDTQTNPFLIGTVAGDRLVGAGLNGNVKLVINRPFGGGPTAIEVTRTGNTNVEMLSGNSILMFGGSSAINIGGLGLSYGMDSALGAEVNFSAESTKTVLDGSTHLDIKGSSSVAGLFGGGSAIALGGTAISEVTGGSHITINTAVQSKGFEGIAAGVMGGGLAVGMMGGKAQSTIGSSQIDLENGVVVGTVGGGVAATADPNSIFGALEVLGMNLSDKVDQIAGIMTDGGEVLKKGGSASVSVGTSVINVKDASTVMLMGGNMALAAGGEATTESSAKAHTETVEINLGGSEVPSEDRSKVVQAAKDAISLIQDLDTADRAKLESIINNVNVPGAHVANLGGGLSVAYSSHDGARVTADSSVTKVVMNMTGGYNVGNLAGGLALAKGTANTKDGEVKATADVTNTFIEISGGESILTAAGGFALATARDGQNTEVKAQANVTNAKIRVTGGIADGLFGGGIAIDDTNVGTTNAEANVGTAVIQIEGGEVNQARMSTLIDVVGGGDVPHQFDPQEGIKETADLVDKAEAAIVGGGLATGSGALVRTETVGINLYGGTVNGNVFGGGAATWAGKAEVGTVVIDVNDDDDGQLDTIVNGDIYAGGMAGSGRNEINTMPGYMQDPKSSVDKAFIYLNGGEVRGNIYAGGYVYEGNTLPEATVGEATIVLADDSVFKGDEIVGTGADKANLTFTDADYTFAENQKVVGFNTITAAGKVTGVDYDFGEREGTKVVGGIVEFKSLTNTENKTLSVGDAEGVGAVAVNPFGDAVSGLTLKVDNGFLALNSDAETAQKAIASAPSQAKASAYVTGTVDLSDNKLLVGVDSSNANGLFVGSDGLLVADAAGSTNVSGSTSFADGSSIHFVNVANGDTVTIGSDGQEATVGTTVDNVLFKVAQDGNKYNFTQREDGEMGEVGLGDSDLGFLSDLKNHDNPGADFISDFLDQSKTGVNNGNRGQQINAAMNLATAAGVQTAAIDGTMMGIEAANKRASIINNFVNGGVLFAEVSGKHSEVGGGSGFGEIEYDLGGLVVGGEYTTNDWTFGALANLGTGSVDGKGDNSKVENDVDYYGLQAYVGKRFGQFNLVGQVGYLMSENDISHSMIGSNTADVDADVWTIGVRGEVRFDVTENSRVVPYVGVNYLRVSTDGYRTSQGVKVDDIDQNLWTTPIGVKYAGDLKTASGWVWTPSVDVAYIPAFGDDEVDATTDVGAIGHITMDVWSNSVGRMKLGITANKGNFGFGLEAGAAAGSDDLTEYFGQLRVDYRF